MFRVQPCSSFLIRSLANWCALVFFFCVDFFFCALCLLDFFFCVVDLFIFLLDFFFGGFFDLASWLLDDFFLRVCFFFLLRTTAPNSRRHSDNALPWYVIEVQPLSCRCLIEEVQFEGVWWIFFRYRMLPVFVNSARCSTPLWRQCNTSFPGCNKPLCTISANLFTLEPHVWLLLLLLRGANADAGVALVFCRLGDGEKEDERLAPRACFCLAAIFCCGSVGFSAICVRYGGPDQTLLKEGFWNLNRRGRGKRFHDTTGQDTAPSNHHHHRTATKTTGTHNQWMARP